MGSGAMGLELAPIWAAGAAGFACYATVNLRKQMSRLVCATSLLHIWSRFQGSHRCPLPVVHSARVGSQPLSPGVVYHVSYLTSVGDSLGERGLKCWLILKSLGSPSRKFGPLNFKT